MRKFLAYTIVVAAFGCAAGLTDPPEGYPVAWMVNGCSPVDGPAVELFFGETVPVDVSQPSYPHARVAGVADVFGRFNARGELSSNGSPSPDPLRVK